MITGNLLPYKPTKRSAVDDEDCYASVSEEIKRCRISCSPGELRLLKDVKETSELNGIWVEFADVPSSVVVRFLNVSTGPSVFLVTVPRYYPHNAPMVRCLEAGFSSDFFRASGEVVHHKLDSDWFATSSLVTVIDILKEIRLSFAQKFSLHDDEKEMVVPCDFVGLDFVTVSDMF